MYIFVEEIKKFNKKNGINFSFLLKYQAINQIKKSIIKTQNHEKK